MASVWGAALAGPGLLCGCGASELIPMPGEALTSASAVEPLTLSSPGEPGSRTPDPGSPELMETAAPEATAADTGALHTLRDFGIFINISGARGIRQNAYARVAANPYVAGVQINITWAQLEPQPGLYDWDPLDALLDQYGRAGKTVGLKFFAAAGKVKGEDQAASDPERVYVNRATPAWLFDDPAVERVGGISTRRGRLPLYPVYWDPAYQSYLASFIAALAERYDGDPRVAYIRAGGWQVGTNEPNFYGGASDLLADQLAARGMNVTRRKGGRIVLARDDAYAQAVRDLIDIWTTAFHESRLAVTIHFSRNRTGLDDPSDGFEAMMNEYAARRGFILLNTGLNESRHDGGRAAFRDYHDRFATPVGWGGITRAAARQAAATSNAATDDRDAVDPKEASHVQRALSLEIMRQAIGIDGDPEYSPASRASYLICGLNQLTHADALRWAAQHLIDPP